MARKAISNDRYRLVGTYERLRKSLLSQPDDGRLDKHSPTGCCPPIDACRLPFSIVRCAICCRGRWTN